MTAIDVLASELAHTQGTRVVWRASMWWLVGYSIARSGEELATPLDENYRVDFERGQRAGGR